MRMFLIPHARVNTHPLSVDLFNLITLGICMDGFGISYILLVFTEFEVLLLDVHGTALVLCFNIVVHIIGFIYFTVLFSQIKEQC